MRRAPICCARPRRPATPADLWYGRYRTLLAWGPLLGEGVTDVQCEDEGDARQKKSSSCSFYTITHKLISRPSEEMPCLTPFPCFDGTVLQNPCTKSEQTQVAGAATRNSQPSGRAEGAKKAFSGPKQVKNGGPAFVAETPSQNAALPALGGRSLLGSFFDGASNGVLFRPRREVGGVQAAHARRPN